jgi:hypothetical protein
LANTKSSISKASTVDSIKEMLETTNDWTIALEVFSSDEFTDLPPFTLDFAKSFLILGGYHQSESPDFPLALCKILEYVKMKKIPECLLSPY